jgi:RNA polymerase sigma-70 factor (ECF subfamily)
VTASTTSGAPPSPECARSRTCEHLPRLRRYARALTGDAARADDLVQDTLERALAKLNLWQPGSDLRAWLFTLMHNLYLNQVRASRPAKSVLDEALDVPVSGGQMEALGARDIHAAIARLPETQREVMLLVGLEQFDYAEAAQVLGMPVGTAMSRLSRARERMRQLLAGEPVVNLKVVK